MHTLSQPAYLLFRPALVSGWRGWVSVPILGVMLGACATPAGDYASAPAPVQLPPTQVYFYPAAGQTPAQQDRDRYECYVWAVRQSGFDPSRPQVPPAPRVEVVPVPPTGEGAALGAVSGAILGAAVSRPHDSGSGAIIGAVLGTMVGASADAARAQQAEQIRESRDRRDLRRYSQVERRAADYRRAMAACLEGRGYTVH